MNYEKLLGASVCASDISLASTSYIDSLAEGGQHGTKEELEQKWEEAKKIANKNAKENPNIVESYAYTTAIFQDLIGVKQKASVALTATEVTARNNYLEKLVRDGKHGTRKHILEQWEEAKAVANRVGIRAYPYMIAVFQNLLGIRKTAASVKIEAAQRLGAATATDAGKIVLFLEHALGFKGVKGVAGPPLETVIFSKKVGQGNFRIIVSLDYESDIPELHVEGDFSAGRWTDDFFFSAGSAGKIIKYLKAVCTKASRELAKDTKGAGPKDMNEVHVVKGFLDAIRK